MFLTDAEVADLTGYQKPSSQIKWLAAEKYGYAVGGDGRPKVLREVVISRLGGVHVRKGPQLRLR
jgi:hypothetical protein